MYLKKEDYFNSIDLMISYCKIDSLESFVENLINLIQNIYAWLFYDNYDHSCCNGKRYYTIKMIKSSLLPM